MDISRYKSGTQRKQYGYISFSSLVQFDLKPFPGKIKNPAILMITGFSSSFSADRTDGRTLFLLHNHFLIRS
ncbi:MAG: hypothetical protein V4511_11995 [Bacteroidota bacterium]